MNLAPRQTRAGEVRGDHKVVASLVPLGGRVLDIGSEDGALLDHLVRERQVDGRGVELSQAGVNRWRGAWPVGHSGRRRQGFGRLSRRCLRRRHSQSDAAGNTREPKKVMSELLRIGKQVIVSIPNFAHWRNRMQLLFRGRMPVTKYLPYEWYDTPNIHFCSLRDFVELCHELDADVEKAIALSAHGNKIPVNAPWWVWNIVAEQAVFLLKR